MLAGDALAARYTAATGEQLPATQIFTRATAGDPQAIAAIDEEAHWLAITVIAVKAILDPQVFVLGGGIGSRKELLPGIRTWLQKLGAHEIDIRSSELGHRAPVAGAVRLALNAVVSATEGQQR
jgi:glucokinase